MNFGIKICAVLAASVALAAPVVAQVRQAGGASNGLTWSAKSTIVGQSSTATVVGGGNPIYLAAKPKYNNTVGLLMNYGNAGSFVCSGTLMSNRISIVTAAHCVTDATLAKPLSTTVFLYNGADDPNVYAGGTGITQIAVANYFINPDYTGEVIDQNDIAVLRLSQLADAAFGGAELYNGGNLTGQSFNVAGLGARSSIGGNFGANLGTGRLRQGDNRYEFAFGDTDFGGFFTNRDANGENFFGFAEIGGSIVSDFDNGLATNDTSCRLAAALGLSGSKYCNTGLGALEVGVAGGDSGGPQFIGGKLASVTSYGLTFGTGFGDVRAGNNSSFGEFSGYVPTSLHSDFLARSMAVPEPSTWAMLIVGFGVIGGTLRTRRAKTVATA